LTIARLSKVERFAIGGVGFAGMMSQGEKDYRSIMGSDSALDGMRELYRTGNLQAKAYALLGIHALDHKAFGSMSSEAKGLNSITSSSEAA
jgi:hypothetical protein